MGSAGANRVMNYFPYLTDDEVLLIGESLSHPQPDAEPALQNLVREGVDIGQMVKVSETHLTLWKQKGGLQKLRDSVTTTLRKVRSLRRFKKARRWYGTALDRFRDEYELIFGAFFPEHFESRDRYLGETSSEEFDLPDLVRPFFGSSGDLNHWEIHLHASATDGLFEVTDSDGVEIIATPIPTDGTLRIPFDDVGIHSHGLWSWCLSYLEDGEMIVRRGQISRLSPEARGQMDRLIAMAERDHDVVSRNLVKALVLAQFECYDAAIRLLRNSLTQAAEQHMQYESLLLLHRVYSKVHQEYCNSTLVREANEILHAIFEVERRMQQLSETTEIADEE
jgi:hypothetical protein